MGYISGDAAGKLQWRCCRRETKLSVQRLLTIQINSYLLAFIIESVCWQNCYFLLLFPLRMRKIFIKLCKHWTCINSPPYVCFFKALSNVNKNFSHESHLKQIDIFKIHDCLKTKRSGCCYRLLLASTYLYAPWSFLNIFLALFNARDGKFWLNFYDFKY